MRNPVITLAAVSAALAIGAGAFGAHAMAGPAQELLRTGGLYQLVHAVAAIALAKRAPRPALMMLGGAAVFAVSLYALALGAPRAFGAITPIGGVTMIAAWLWVALSRLG